MEANSPGAYAGLQLANRYTITEPLAHGALATVLRGDDSVLRRPVAVKAVAAAHADAYRAALRVTATLTHPATVTTYDAIERDGTLFVVQEFVPGYALSSYLRQGLPTERVVTLGVQIARVLSYANRHDVQHGDLTPAAVLVDRRAVVRVNNFGLPRDENYFRETRQLVAASRADLTDESDADASTPEGDAWALGALLWRLLSEPDDARNARRFRADVPVQMRSRIAQALLSTTDSVDALAASLESLADAMERDRTSAAVLTPPALRAAREVAARAASWSVRETLSGPRGWGAAGAADIDLAAPTDPVTVADVGATRSAADLDVRVDGPRLRLPSRPVSSLSSEAPRWTGGLSPDADPPTLPTGPATAGPRINLFAVLLLGGVLFVIFFLIGYFGPLLFGVH